MAASLYVGMRVGMHHQVCCLLLRVSLKAGERSPTDATAPMSFFSKTLASGASQLSPTCARPCLLFCPRKYIVFFSNASIVAGSHALQCAMQTFGSCQRLQLKKKMFKLTV